MDAKVTKVRLSRMLSYDWFKIILSAAGLIVLWVLIFTVSATRVMSSQEFIVGNYVGNASFTSDYYDSLRNTYKENGFSFEVLKVGTEDFAASGNEAYQLLEARTATDEVDMIYVSQQDHPSSLVSEKGEDGETVETYEYTYLESFLTGYSYQLHKIDEYLAEMDGFLKEYYNGDYTVKSNLDEEKVEKAFRARCKGDKRYKKESQIQKGVEGEIDRMQKYSKALLSFNKYLSEGKIAITHTLYEYESSYGDKKYTVEGNYSINIYPETAQKGLDVAMTKYIGYYIYQESEGEDGEITKTPVKTAKNMNVCFFDSNGKEKAYRYEGLIYLMNFMDEVYENFKAGK